MWLSTIRSAAGSLMRGNCAPSRRGGCSTGHWRKLRTSRGTRSRGPKRSNSARTGFPRRAHSTRVYRKARTRRSAPELAAAGPGTHEEWGRPRPERAYGQLAGLGAVRTTDVPAELLGRHLRCAIQRDKAEAERLLADLERGRWALTRGQFSFYWPEEAQVAGRDATLPRVPR